MFGSSQARYTNRASTSSTTATKKAFVSPVLDIKPGLRIFRLLPQLPLEQVQLGNSVAYVPEHEVEYGEYWIMVNDSKNPRGSHKQRVFVDPIDPFSNYLWTEVYSKLPKTKADGKKNTDRALAKSKFAVNVYDRTPVIMLESGVYVYPDQEGLYKDANGTVLDASQKKPRNAIMILEGTNGAEGGKHVMGKLTDLIKNMTVEDAEGNDVPAPCYEYDIRLTSAIPAGGEANDVNRSAIGGQVKPLPDQNVLWQLPRYRLADFYKPYPNEALEALVQGADLPEVLEKYNIPRWVKLPESNDEDEDEDGMPF